MSYLGLSSFSSKEQASFNFMAADIIHGYFGAQENKICHCFHCFPICCHEMMGLDAMNVDFRPTFSLSSFISSRCSLVPLHFLPLRVVSSAYLRLLIFLPAILIPACASSSPAFLTMYPAYKLNKQGDNIQP